MLQGEGKPGSIFFGGAEVKVIAPNPPMAAACATGAGIWRRMCCVRCPPRSHRCHPVSSAALLPSPAPAGGSSPAPKPGHQLSIGGHLGLQLLLSGQVKYDFQYMGGDIK